MARGVDQTAAFFGAGTLLLASAISFESAFLNRRSPALIGSLKALALRNAAYRPGRSILCIAQIACATFLIVSVAAFRQTGDNAGAGGYPLMAESVLPLIHDPNTAAGRESLNIPPLSGVTFVPFRLRPGDDTSCLNLYQPRNPRILAPSGCISAQRAFPVPGVVSHAANPWLLLDATLPGGAIPAIADANSMTYVLHLEAGRRFRVERDSIPHRRRPAGQPFPE